METQCPDCKGCGQLEETIDSVEWYTITNEYQCPRCGGYGIITVEAIRDAVGRLVPINV